MKKHKSPTKNGGTTVVLDSAADAIKLGEAYANKLVEAYAKQPKDRKVDVNFLQRDEHDPMEGHCAKSKKQTGCKMTYGALLASAKDRQRRFTQCEEAIVKGDPETKEAISRMMEELHDMALDLAPSLKANHAGFQRSEDGFSASPELLAAGEEKCCIQRKDEGEGIKGGEGAGAYRLIINTDVSWWGQPSDNAAMVGALTLILQQFHPVEVWIQQGWLGSHDSDGITLFKLDFTGAFDPTALTFWIGHHDKDQVFSYFINMELGRENTSTSTTAEIEADLMLRGDWMKVYGIDEGKFGSMLHTEKMDLMARWIADTAMQIAFNPTEQGPLITG